MPLTRSLRSLEARMARIPWQRLQRLWAGWRTPGDYRDTLERLLRGDFADLSPEARREKIEQIIAVSTQAAVLLGMAPVPFLDIPVQGAMVRAIAKVHGVRGHERKLLLQVAAALGGGALIRQALRLIPVAGGLSRATRVYAATWALGRAADRYYAALARDGRPPAEADVRAEFEHTLHERARSHAERMDATDAEARLRELKRLHDQGLIDEAEYRHKRGEILAGL